jgi:hypothetical protein
VEVTEEREVKRMDGRNDKERGGEWCENQVRGKEKGHSLTGGKRFVG